MARYIHNQKNWPQLFWNDAELIAPLAEVRHKQGMLRGYLDTLGFTKKTETSLSAITMDVLKSSEIEGMFLNPDQVRSSIARKLGLDIAGLVPSDRDVDGIVEVMLDATQKHKSNLSKERLFAWHSSLFPTGRSGLYKIEVGQWRSAELGPMQVVSGAFGKERVHFEAPDSKRLNQEMKLFLNWFNKEKEMDGVLKSGLAHFWFVTIHPFDDGNGRIARAIADMQLARTDNNQFRFYSMSAQIRKERKRYYEVLESTQKGGLDITEWMQWYLHCLDAALTTSEKGMKGIFQKNKFWDAHLHMPINERQRKIINKLFDGLDGKLNSSKWAKMCKCSADTALRDIQDLITKKILQKHISGGRSTNYELYDF